MTHWASGVLICVAVASIAMPAAGEEASAVEVLEARQLADGGRSALLVDRAGRYVAWAWQRGGVEVRWMLAGKDLPAATAEAKPDAFAWVRLGEVDLPAGQAVPVAVMPAPAGAKHPAAAVLAVGREASFDPRRLWRLTRVRPESPDAVGDHRPSRCRHLDMRFTMPAHATKPAWEARAAWLREHVRVSTGLLPEPDRTELKPRVFGRVEREGYTVEKAFFESRPGFYVCGNLCARGVKGPRPGVACPHGHWGNGRLNEAVQARCITLARRGYVVFSYDMIGYNDSGKQLGGHRGVFPSPRNDLWGISPMHLQSWNTIRAIDFLQSLADVDGKRIGLTGCSGGGTQTFMVMGIDPRVTAAAPVCMVSGIMQGGCECENAPLLRIETNNIEIAALMAPRPLIVPSATGDWTKETPKVELPGIRGVYELYGAADRLAGKHVDAGHGYHKPHREAVYGFFDRWVRGGGDGKSVDEPAFHPEAPAELLVFHDRKLPAGAKTPATLVADIVAQCRRQRDELLPARPGDRRRFDETLGAAYRHAVAARLPKPGELAVKQLGSTTAGDVLVTRLLLGRKGQGDRVPALLYRAKGAAGDAPACVVVHPSGKAGLIDAATARPGALLAKLLAGGRTVLAIDAYLTGEFSSAFAETEQKRDKGFFSTYNRTELVQRVQDILTALAYLEGRGKGGPIGLIGLGQAGAWCLLAGPLTPPATAVAADLAQLSGDDDPRWEGDLFTPCILKAGGVRTAVALAAPRRMLLHNLAKGFDAKPLQAAYAAAGGKGKLRMETRPLGADAVARWLGTK